MKNKFGILQDDKENEFKYSNTWWLQKYPSFTRGIVAPSEFHIDIMLGIAKYFPEPFWVLYVLVKSRVGNEPGRYQCPQPVTYQELERFCLRFKEFFESDGRHHLWIPSATTNQMIIYDRHNVIYIYDHEEAIRAYFDETIFKENEVRFPTPHIHYYHKENDEFESEIIDYWNWRYSRLKEEDEI